MVAGFPLSSRSAKIPGPLDEVFGSRVGQPAVNLAILLSLMEGCVVKLRLRDNESIGDAVKRFRKLVEHAGIKKEMRRREFYEKPSETSRRSRRRAERRAKIQRMVGNNAGV